MRTFCTRFVRTAAVLAVAMLFGAPSFAQTAGKVNTERDPVPSAGAKQNPPSPPSAKGPATPNVGAEREPLAAEPMVRKTKEERMAARAKRKADRADRAAKRPPMGGEAIKY